jgi:mRNA-degrading endonuclease toxin of MazEF toxin-antitoxin module
MLWRPSGSGDQRVSQKTGGSALIPKRRPVLVLSCDEVVPMLDNIIVSPVTSTIREPTCIPVGVDGGIDHDRVATFDNLAAVPKSVLTRRLGQLDLGGRQRI